MDRHSRKDMLLMMLEKEPDDVFFNYVLVIEFIGENKLVEAEKQFLKTLTLSAEYLPCYYQLGLNAEKLNKKNEALEHYSKGLEIAKKQKNKKAIHEINEAITLLEE